MEDMEDEPRSTLTRVGGPFDSSSPIAVHPAASKR